MRKAISAVISLTYLLSYTSTGHAITLTQFQTISGFSSACTDAYNTPLSGCAASDFASGSCSTTCIAFLDALTKIINSECGGTSALPNTLIGSFFKNEGTGQICPNVLSGGQGASSLSSYPYTFTSASLPSSSTGTMPLISAAPSTSSSSGSPSSTASIDFTTTSVAVIDTTVAPMTPTNLMTFSTATLHTQSSSTSSSSSKSISDESGKNGGGGSPLDVGSTSGSAASCTGSIEAWILCLLAGSAGLLWLL